jgi:hypothetical protein
MGQKKFKSFTELYMDIAWSLSKKYNMPLENVIHNMSDKEDAIRHEYENKLIMDEMHYIDKFIQ